MYLGREGGIRCFFGDFFIFWEESLLLEMFFVCLFVLGGFFLGEFDL